MEKFERKTSIEKQEKKENNPFIERLNKILENRDIKDLVEQFTTFLSLFEKEIFSLQASELIALLDFLIENLGVCSIDKDNAKKVENNLKKFYFYGLGIIALGVAIETGKLDDEHINRYLDIFFRFKEFKNLIWFDFKFIFPYIGRDIRFYLTKSKFIISNYVEPIFLYYQRYYIFKRSALNNADIYKIKEGVIASLIRKLKKILGYSTKKGESHNGYIDVFINILESLKGNKILLENVGIFVFRDILSMISYGFYYIQILFLIKGFVNEIKNDEIRKLINEFLLKVYEFYQFLFSSENDFHEIIKLFSKKAYIVLLGNLYLLKKYSEIFEIQINKNEVNKRLENMKIYLDKEKSLREYIEEALISPNSTEGEFLKYYLGLNFKKVHDNSIIIEEINNQESFVGLLNKSFFKQDDINEIIKILYILKKVPFKVLNIFSDIAYSLLPEIYKNESFIKDFTEKGEIDLQLVESYQRLICKSNIDDAIRYFVEAVKKIYKLEIDEKFGVNIFVDGGFNILNINDLLFSPKGNYNINFISDIDNIGFDNGRIFVNEKENKVYLYHLLNLHGEIKRVIVEFRVNNINKKNLQGFINPNIKILIDSLVNRILWYYVSFIQINEKIYYLTEYNQETIEHMEGVYFLLYSLYSELLKKDEGDDLKIIDKIVEDIKNYLGFTKKDDVFRLISYFHDIGKAEIYYRLQVFSKFNPRTYTYLNFIKYLKDYLQISFEELEKERKKIEDEKEYERKYELYNKVADLVRKRLLENPEREKYLRKLIPNIISIDFLENNSKELYERLSILAYYIYLDLKKNEDFEKININIFSNENLSKEIYEKLTNILLTKEIDINKYLLIFLTLLDKYNYFCIQEIQGPHITEAFDKYEDTPFKKLLIFLFHHKYPNITEDYKRYINQFLQKYYFKTKYYEIFKNQIINDKESYWPLHLRPPIVQLLIVSDIISALYLQNREYNKYYINHVANDDFNRIFSPSFREFLIKKYDTRPYTYEEIIGLLDGILGESDFYQSKLRPILLDKSFREKLAIFKVKNEGSKFSKRVNEILSEIFDQKEEKLIPKEYYVLYPGKEYLLYEEGDNIKLKIGNQELILSRDILSSLFEYYVSKESIKETSKGINFRVNRYLVLSNNGEIYEKIDIKSMFTDKLSIHFGEGELIFNVEKKEDDGICLSDVKLKCKNIVDKISGLSFRIDGNLIVDESLNLNVENVKIEAPYIRIKNLQAKDCKLDGIFLSINSIYGSGNILVGENIQIENLRGNNNTIFCGIYENLRKKGFKKQIKINELHGNNTIFALGSRIEIGKVEGNVTIILDDSSELVIESISSHVDVNVFYYSKINQKPKVKLPAGAENEINFNKISKEELQDFIGYKK